MVFKKQKSRGLLSLALLINGFELPANFSKDYGISEIVISQDCKRYAVITKNGHSTLGNMPSDGIIQVDENVIECHTATRQEIRDSKEDVKTDSSTLQPTILIKNEDHQTLIRNNPPHEINEYHPSVKRLILTGNSNDVNLGLSDDALVYVRGEAVSEWTYKHGRLSVKGLDGKVSIPKSGLELGIKTSAGNILGDITNKGRMKTLSGDIIIKLYSPITIKASASKGNVQVKGMISKGGGMYLPPNAKSIGELVLETSQGDIKVEYMLP